MKTGGIFFETPPAPIKNFESRRSLDFLVQSRETWVCNNRIDGLFDCQVLIWIRNSR